MTEHTFGDVKVLEAEVAGKPDAIIRFVSQRLFVPDAEKFAMDLMSAIIKAREIINDPI
jgi:hypothetical protein